MNSGVENVFQIHINHLCLPFNNVISKRIVLKKEKVIKISSSVNIAGYPHKIIYKFKQTESWCMTYPEWNTNDNKTWFVCGYAYIFVKGKGGKDIFCIKRKCIHVHKANIRSMFNYGKQIYIQIFDIFKKNQK